jgi:hypothetical protein
MRPNNTLKLELRKRLKLLVGFQGLIKEKPKPHNQTIANNARIEVGIYYQRGKQKAFSNPC